jgi:uncharacterized protein (DUF1684 family)
MTTATPPKLPSDMNRDLNRDLKHEVDAWRAEKDRQMQGPESPLAFAGRLQLQPGHNTLGSAADDGLKLESLGLPEHVLDLYVQDVRVQLKVLVPMVALNGQPVEQAYLQPGDAVEVGPVRLVYQGGLGVTLFDRSRPTALSYRGLKYLPLDAHYRVPATFEPAAAGKTLILETTQNDTRELPFRGVLRFTLQGKALSLEGFQLGDNPDLFVIFRDATSGKETYGAGRFLWVKAPINGTAVVDFNLAWNPLCAYADGYSCPLAPPENRLSVPIPVGEAPYHH